MSSENPTSAPITIRQEGLEPSYQGKGPLRLQLLVANESDQDIPAGAFQYTVRCGGHVMRDVDAHFPGIGAGETFLLADVLVIFFPVKEAVPIVLKVRLEAGEQQIRGEWQSSLLPPA